MILELYDKKHENKYPISDYKDYSIKHTLRYGDKELRITIPLNSKYADLVEEEMYIRNKTTEYVIKEVNPNDNWLNIVAKLNIEDVEGKSWETFESKEATITDCVNTSLAGTGWQVGECSITKKRTIRKDFCNSWDIIKQAVKTYRVEIELDTINKKINIYEQIGTDKGSFFMESLNLKELSIQSNSYDYCTKLIAIGGTVDKEDGTKERISCTVTNNTYSNKVIEQIWKDERYTVLADLQEDAQAKLDEISKPYRSYSAKPYSIGNCTIGDTITLISKKNKTYNKFRIVSYIEYPEEIGKDEIEIANSILSFEDIQKEFEEARDTVNNITSDNGTISESAISIKTFENIYARSVVANKVQALEGDFGTLNTTKANITELNATNAKVQNLEANSATITDLQSATARIGVLEAGYGQIQVLNTDVANINTLLAGNVSAGSTQTIVLNANNTTIANALIKSAMIESINADKINAGSINTDNVTIKSSSGGIQIADNTMQFKDKNNKVRIQIGQDTSNNFNFIVRAEDGTTTLIDGTGVKEKAIADKLIKTKMINDKAVTGVKIDWDDFFETINNDGTHTLNSNKVKLNSNNQTLDVAFNQMTTKIENKGEGRNLCRKGWHINQDTNGRATLEITKDDWFDYILKFNKLNASGWGILTNDKKIAFEYGKKYTLSFKAHTTDLTNIQVRICSESFTDTVLYPTVISLKKDGEYYDYSLTFEAKTSTSQYLQFMSDNGTVYLTNIKLEKGDEATTFCDAPEDLSDWIKTNSTSISVQQGKISSLITDTEQLTIKSNNNATAINTLNTNYSKISQTVNEINSTVSSHTTTIQGLQTSVNNANSRINQLKDSIELKVNTSTYNTDKQGILADISNNSSTITQLNKSISLKVEQTDITNAINNINIGGRNYIRNGDFTNSNNYWWINSNSSGNSVSSVADTKFGNCCKFTKVGGDWCILTTSSDATFIKNKKYTLSFWAKADKDITIQARISTSSSSYFSFNSDCLVKTDWIKFSYTFNWTYDGKLQNYPLQFVLNDITTIYLANIKLEEGNKATDYCKAIEDVTAYTDVKVSSVEQEVTASAITTKISTAINNGTSSINTTYFTQDNKGLTIKNGGIKVLNSLNTQIFGVGTDGYLDIRGAFTQYNSNGKKSIEIKSNKISIYNYKSINDDLVGGFANVNDFTNTSGDSGIALYGTQGHALSIGMERDSTITKYITCVDNGDGGVDRRIDVNMETYFRGWGATFCNNNFIMRGFIKADAEPETGLCIVGANSVHLGYGSSSSNYAPGIDISSKGIVIWGNVTVVGTINGQRIGN